MSKNEESGVVAEKIDDSVATLSTAAANAVIGEPTLEESQEVFRVTVVDALNRTVEKSAELLNAVDPGTQSRDQIMSNVAWALDALRDYPTVPKLPELDFDMKTPSWDEIDGVLKNMKFC